MTNNTDYPYITQEQHTELSIAIKKAVKACENIVSTRNRNLHRFWFWRIDCQVWLMAFSILKGKYVIRFFEKGRKKHFIVLKNGTDMIFGTQDFDNGNSLRDANKILSFEKDLQLVCERLTITYEPLLTERKEYCNTKPFLGILS